MGVRVLMKEQPHESLELLMDGLFSEKQEEIHVEMSVASECAWAGELRWIPHPNFHGRPDLSVSVYVTGQASPDDLIEALVDGFLKLDHGLFRKEFA